MTGKVILEEAIEKLYEKHGDKISMFNYSKMGKRADFVCNICGYNWTTFASDVINGGRGCKKCGYKSTGKKLTLSYSEVYDRIKNRGCILISEIYVNNSEDLDIKYPCGHINSLSLNCFSRNKVSCRKCFLETYYKFRYSEDDIVEILKLNNLKFLKFEEEYKDGSSKIIYECPFGHITIRDVKYVIKFPTCKKCSYRKKETHGWVGAKTLAQLGRSRIEKWNKESLEFYNYVCAISGKDYDLDVHHLYGFNMIFDESVYNCNFSIGKEMKEYSEQEIDFLMEEIERLHKNREIGICLHRPIHVLFHNFYGRGNNTPDQFYEFVERIKSGEIKIPD
jgi:hypothetical protein